MDNICHHCSNNIEYGHCGYIAISKYTKDEYIVGSLYFHHACFQEVAGVEYVEALNQVSKTFGLTFGEQYFIEKGKHIDAIKEIRRRIKRGLKEAKGLADMYRDNFLMIQKLKTK